MQIAITIALTVFYVGISLMLGGVHPKSGMPWWFFAPTTVAFLASFVAITIIGKLPLPWVKKQQYSLSPRRVRPSWRGVFWLPVWAPLLLVPWHFLYILRMHADIGWVLYLVVVLALALLARQAIKRWREIRLLRSGEVTMAIVHSRQVTGEWTDRIVYQFKTAGGETVSGRAWDVGYNVSEGSSVPVFYNANNPTNHVIACASWFEAD
ncbi:MAG: hypothetical protein EPN25_05285 [Nitrospirae bacterium]|nr:MAG: hypothetical protein EPN25_05285 [Nitrospirota bacterium]